MDDLLIVVIAVMLSPLCGAVGALIGYNVGAKKPNDKSVVSALCRTLDSVVKQNTAQARRSQDMASLAQEQQLDRINAEYLADTAYKQNTKGIPANGYIEEPEYTGDQYEQEIP